MDTKMQALEKAQKMQREIIENCCSADIVYWRRDRSFSVGGERYEHEDPKPLERDTLGFVMIEPSKSVFLYSTGQNNEWYPPGCNSKNYSGWCGKTILCDNFEVVETPGDMKHLMTSEWLCCYYKCADRFYKWNDGKLREKCKSCTVPTGKPSKLNVRK